MSRLYVSPNMLLGFGTWLMSCLIMSCTSDHSLPPPTILIPGQIWSVPEWEPTEVAADSVFIQELKPRYVPVDSSNMTDWQIAYPSKGESVKAYIAGNPIRPYAERQFIYVGILGELRASEQQMFESTCEYLSLFWGVPVKYFGRIPTTRVPEYARRRAGGKLQFQTTYILHQIMAKELPADAVNFILLTSVDLWPGNGWNFVFGQAAPEQRVGIWSMARHGKPDRSVAERQLVTRRTLKTASHEVGHMFSLDHCVFYECIMQGSMHQEEADKKPVFLCPVCLQKGKYVCEWNTRQRFLYLRDYWAELGFVEETRQYERQLE